MLKNYIKMAQRSLRQRKGYTFLNVTGLSVGIAACLLIALYVRHEWNYDNFHTNADRIYRLIYEHRRGTDLGPATLSEFKAWGSAAIAGPLESDFPEIEHAVRLSGRHEILLSREDNIFQEEHYFFADPAFFDVFSFPLLKGNPSTALDQPGSIVLAERAAQRYFGEEDALGKTLKLGSDPSSRYLTVTGVMADLPANTHLEFDVLISMSTFENEARANDQAYKFDMWGYIDFFTYVLLEPDVSVNALQAKLPDFVQRHIDSEMLDGATYSLALEPIQEIYLSPVSGFQPGPKGNENSLYIFSIIGVFIVLIASVNFMNLSTAQAERRSKEVGIRKTVGAGRSLLIGQFLTEVFFLVTIAAMLALVLAALAIPLFRDLAGKEIQALSLVSMPVLGMLIAGILIVGVFTGSYPALVLSAFRPAHVLKGNTSTTGRGAVLRHILVVFQFSIAIVLIAGTFVVRKQLNFLQERPLGFDDEQQLVIDFGGDPGVRDNIKAVKQSLSALPVVRNVSATRSIPGGYFPHATTDIEAPDGRMQRFDPGIYEVDFDFLSQINVEVAAGRLFSRNITTDSVEALILNEAAVHEIGYADATDAVGKRFEQWDRTGTIIGVVKDFNYESLQNSIQPLSFRVSPWLRYVVLQIATDDAATAVAEARNAWDRLVPHRPFLYSFLDQSFDAQYRADEKFGVLFGVFAALAIFIACLGLFGLAAFAAQQRTKEIGIRKVLGASVSGLAIRLTKNFVGLVLVGFLVAVPAVYIVMSRWLDRFAYRVDIDLGILLLAGGVAIAIAILTISYESVRAAITDPVKSLRYE